MLTIALTALALSSPEREITTTDIYLRSDHLPLMALHLLTHNPNYDLVDEDHQKAGRDEYDRGHNWN